MWYIFAAAPARLSPSPARHALAAPKRRGRCHVRGPMQIEQTDPFTAEPSGVAPPRRQHRNASLAVGAAHG